MKTADTRGKVNSAATLNLVGRLVLCIVFLHPPCCEAQQIVRQKPQTPPRQIGQPPVASQPLNQTAAPVAVPQGANQPGTQAAPTAATPVAGDNTRASAAHAPAQTQLPPAKAVTFSDRMGGAVYSTGAEDIYLWILPNARGPRSPREKLWKDARTWVHSGIYLVSPGPERFLGPNIPGNVTMNLGKIPAGEIIFAIKTFDGFTFQTGGADRNFDKEVHAFTRTFQSGVVEVWFEDSAGGRRDRDMDDVAFQLSGGVHSYGQLAEVQKAVDEQSGGKRDARPAVEGAKP